MRQGVSRSLWQFGGCATFPSCILRWTLRVVDYDESAGDALILGWSSHTRDAGGCTTGDWHQQRRPLDLHAAADLERDACNGGARQCEGKNFRYVCAQRRAYPVRCMRVRAQCVSRLADYVMAYPQLHAIGVVNSRPLHAKGPRPLFVQTAPPSFGLAEHAPSTCPCYAVHAQRHVTADEQAPHDVCSIGFHAPGHMQTKLVLCQKLQVGASSRTVCCKDRS